MTDPRDDASPLLGFTPLVPQAPGDPAAPATDPARAPGPAGPDPSHDRSRNQEQGGGDPGPDAASAGGSSPSPVISWEDATPPGTSPPPGHSTGGSEGDDVQPVFGPGTPVTGWTGLTPPAGPTPDGAAPLATPSGAPEELHHGQPGAAAGSPVLAWRPILPREAIGEAIGETAPSAQARPLHLGGWPGFQGGEREYPDRVQEHVELHSPGKPPEPPAASQLIFTIAIAVLGVIVFVGWDNRRIEAALLLVLATTPVLAVLLTEGHKAFTYHRTKRRREQWYRLHLQECQQRLGVLRERQCADELKAHPSPETCLMRTEGPSRRLWDRSLLADDALDVRVGRGEVAPTFTIGPLPQQPDPLVEDPLVTQARAVVADYQQNVLRVPIALPLGRVGAAALVGPSPQRENLIRAMIVHLAAHHPPDALKLVICVPSSESDSWEWARKLPHTFNDSWVPRFVLDTKSGFAELDRLREKLIEKRKEYLIDGRNVAPIFVFVFVGVEVLLELQANGHDPLLDLIFSQGRTLGAYALFAAERSDQLPRECDDRIEITSDDVRLVLAGVAQGRTVFEPDAVDPDLALRFGNAVERLWDPNLPASS